MIIHSNISKKQKYHDGILYEPIEKQIYNELSKSYDDIKYEITDEMIFKIDCCILTITVKNNIRIKIDIDHFNYYSKLDNGFYDIKPHFIKLKPNIDISKQWEEMLNYIDNINKFNEEYYLLPYEIKLEDIEKELDDYFANDILDCRFFNTKNDTDVLFYLTIKYQPPADGILFKILTHKELFVYKHMNINNLLYHIREFDDSPKMLVKKLELINYINEKINNFDLNNFPLLMKEYNRTLRIKQLIQKYNIIRTDKYECE
jgi:hypothetical protein